MKTKTHVIVWYFRICTAVLTSLMARPCAKLDGNGVLRVSAQFQGRGLCTVHEPISTDHFFLFTLAEQDSGELETV